MCIQNPKVSICIPTYKQLEYLKRALDSLTIQTFTDFEIIVSDDTPDNSVEDFLKNYDFDGKLKYFKNPKSLGSPENWNEAIRKSKGEYIKILHHDDWLTYDNSLDEYVKLLDENPKADFGFSATNVFHADTSKTRFHCISNCNLELLYYDPLLLFFANHIGAPSATIYRNKRIKQYDNKMKWLVDTDFYIRMLCENPIYSISNKPLITTVTAANHTVTEVCFSNKQIQIFEHLHLFNKINNSIKKENYRFYINHLMELLNRFNISSVAEIRKLGYTENLPIDLERILSLKILPRFLFRYIYKLYITKKEVRNHPLYRFLNND